MGSLEHRISLMTPDERLQRLRELQAKAAPMIEQEREVSEDEATEVEEDRAPSSSVDTDRRGIS